MAVDTLTEPEALAWLHDAARAVTSTQAIVELGTYRGGSLKHLVAGAKSGNQAQCFGVDAWAMDGAYIGRPHMLERYVPRDKGIAARVARGATLIHALTVDAGVEWDGPSVGLLYIDAEHRERAVRADFDAWRPHLAPGATVAFDDYCTRFPGVMRAVDALAGAGLIDTPQVIGTRLAVATYRG